MSARDLAKELRPLYAPSAKHPAIVEVPRLSFLMLDGRGDPNTSEEYVAAIGALYGTAYTLKFTLKKADPARDFKVMPLEGLWWTEAGDAPGLEAVQADRDAWRWTAMLAVPETLSGDEVADAVAAAHKRHPSQAFAKLRLEDFEEGLAVQIMHLGPYAEETPTIARIHEFAREQGYELRGRHHEIYLSDPRRTAPERLKTVVRQPLASAG